MNPTPSEEILIKRILDALADSAKTALGIANYIKAKFYRVETTYEIKRVIKKYLLGVHIQFEPYFEVYRLIKPLPVSGKNQTNSSPKTPIQQSIEVPDKVGFLNELYKRRQYLLSLPLEERIKNKRLEIIETNTEIECLKPLAVEELTHLKEIERKEVIKSLFAGLRTELERIQFPKDKTDWDEDDLNDEDDHEEHSEHYKSEKTEDSDSSAIEPINEESEIDQSSEEEEEKKNDVENKNVLPEEVLTVEQAIKLVLEEKTRLGTLEGNLLAENIIFRLKKGKWD